MSWKKRQGIMLCQPLDDRNLARNFKLCPKMLAQPKLDGVRCWVEWRDHSPLLWSSEGNLIEGVPHISLLLKDWAKECGELNFDGELYDHYKPFEGIVSIVTRGSANLHPDYATLAYHIFDVKSERPNLERAALLREAFQRMPLEVKRHKVFRRVQTEVVGPEDIDALLEQWVQGGYEGIILRNPLAPYVEKRPFTILKWKPSKNDIYEVVELEEAVSEKGEPLGRLGSVTCKDRWGNLFKVGLGLGITHQGAETLWRVREVLVGKMAKVHYQNLTTKGVPRFGKCSHFIEPSEEEESHV